MMSWTTNTRGQCNNPACEATIYWNELVTHPKTGRRRPLDAPYYPDQGQPPKLHLCMKQKKPGVFIDKYAQEDKRKEEEFLKDAPNIPRPAPGVKLGQTHLYYNGKFMELLKCPFCNFRNIHQDTMAHHIKFTKDKKHQEGQVDKEGGK